MDNKISGEANPVGLQWYHASSSQDGIMQLSSLQKEQKKLLYVLTHCLKELGRMKDKTLQVLLLTFPITEPST